MAGLAIGAAIAASSHASGAEFSAKDGQVLGRTLSFVGDGMTSVAVLGVVVSPSSPASQRDADAIRAVIGDDLLTGRVRLRVRLITVDQLAAVTGVAALYVTSGLAGSMDII